jgi:hypothetical protein
MLENHTKKQMSAVVCAEYVFRFVSCTKQGNVPDSEHVHFTVFWFLAPLAANAPFLMDSIIHRPDL